MHCEFKRSWIFLLFTEVLKDNKVFSKCFRRGNFAACDFVTAYFISNGSPYNRMGISVGKKNGNAVQRNRIKRIIRAAYRINEDKFPIGYDIVFAARNNICEKKSDDIEWFINKRLLKKMSGTNKENKKK